MSHPLRIIPILGRLSLLDYVRLAFSFIVVLTLNVLNLVFVLFPFFRSGLDVIRRVWLSRFVQPDAPSQHTKIIGRYVLQYLLMMREEEFDKLSTTEDFARFWGYPFETHYVKTTDGFLLALHRIKQGRSPPNRHHPQNGSAKPVVLFWHGFLMCSEVWVCRPDPHYNLAFLLADLGYDVWLGNTRGNKYSSKHCQHKPSQDAYWDFSLDHLALYDMPESVDYILKLTAEPALTYIGFSHGTVQGFSSLSIHHSLQQKINLFIALAPVIKPHGLENRTISTLVQTSPELIYLLFGRRCMLASEVFWQSFLSKSTFVATIDVAVKGLFSWTSQYLPDKSIIYRHLYSFTSVKIVVHWFQIIRTGRLQMYDENPPIFPLVYTKSSPAPVHKGHVTPKFPTDVITTPIALFYGGQDTLLDMDVLIERLGQPPVFCLRVEEYEHLHFLWGEHIEKCVYPYILTLLKHYQSCVSHSIPADGSSSLPSFQSCRGSVLSEGDSVDPLDLCWGLHDERGPLYDTESNPESLLQDPIGRSVRRQGPITVTRDMHSIIVYDAQVSIKDACFLSEDTCVDSDSDQEQNVQIKKLN